MTLGTGLSTLCVRVCEDLCSFFKMTMYMLPRLNKKIRYKKRLCSKVPCPAFHLCKDILVLVRLNDIRVYWKFLCLCSTELKGGGWRVVSFGSFWLSHSNSTPTRLAVVTTIIMDCTDITSCNLKSKKEWRRCKIRIWYPPVWIFSLFFKLMENAK